MKKKVKAYHTFFILFHLCRLILCWVAKRLNPGYGLAAWPPSLLPVGWCYAARLALLEACPWQKASSDSRMWSFQDLSSQRMFDNVWHTSRILLVQLYDFCWRMPVVPSLALANETRRVLRQLVNFFQINLQNVPQVPKASFFVRPQPACGHVVWVLSAHPFRPHGSTAHGEASKWSCDLKLSNETKPLAKAQSPLNLFSIQNLRMCAKHAWLACATCATRASLSQSSVSSASLSWHTSHSSFYHGKPWRYIIYISHTHISYIYIMTQWKLEFFWKYFCRWDLF